MHISDPDYARIYTKIRAYADSYGWAAILHGSATRDLDILLVPWDEKARAENAQQIIARLVENEKLKPVGEPAQKPHGRIAQNFKLPGFGDPRWVDLGWMSVSTLNPLTNAKGSGESDVVGYRLTKKVCDKGGNLTGYIHHPIVYKHVEVAVKVKNNPHLGLQDYQIVTKVGYVGPQGFFWLYEKPYGGTKARNIPFKFDSTLPESEA